METYRALSGPSPPATEQFSVVDTLMPYPIDAPLSWVCVPNPGVATFETFRPLLADAYGIAARRWARRQERR